MFIDRAKIYIKSGKGGNGIVSFRREKYIAAGGPDGGDGGNGGNVIFTVNEGETTLADFRFKRKYTAGNGADGGSNKRKGKRGENIVVKVPRGTIIRDSATGRMLADMTEPGVEKIIAAGGKGGLGNMHFATATRQVPNFARAGQEGVEMELTLELKLLADVGLVGFPNVGKSTLLSVTTGARPEIADYHFTTITPNLGVVFGTYGPSFVMADIPGLIEGASEGLGLGYQFLRHVERTRLIIHVIDISGSEGRDPFEDFLKINQELTKYNLRLSKRPQIIALNKIDMPGAEEKLADFKERFAAWKQDHGTEIQESVENGAWCIFEICAPISYGTKELMAYVERVLGKMPLPEMDVPDADFALYEAPSEEELFEVNVTEDGVYEVTGKWIKGVIDSTNLYDNESSQYFQRLIRKKGLVDELERLGIKDGDLVRIYETEFEFYK